MYKSNQEEDYELDTGCIKWMNVFAEYHNHKLLEELDRLRKHNPSTTIIYVDYYNAAMNIFRSPDSYGFGREPFAACCGGGGGPHNFDPSICAGAIRLRCVIIHQNIYPGMDCTLQKQHTKRLPIW
ncbi:GDSL esterase/lipase-like [Iris pallida]|uniref:GDSL esterase/lipase-like n=1 Tax=Iris pallida TaxID=29817 RepID=A0AAX6HXA5_IRIPA|nr:GDSL esterase/lipase-like [Iris pallida]